MHARILLIALCCTAAAAWPGDSGATEPTGYSITGRVPGSGGAWDYAVVDEHSGRLFLAQAGVPPLDLESNTVRTGLGPGKVPQYLAPPRGRTPCGERMQRNAMTLCNAAAVWD